MRFSSPLLALAALSFLNLAPAAAFDFIPGGDDIARPTRTLEDHEDHESQTKATVIPLLAFDLGISHKIVSLAQTSTTNAVVVNPVGGGYRATYYKRIDGGAGVGVLIRAAGEDGQGPTGQGLGLMPVIGSTAVVSHYAETLGQIPSLEKVEIPQHANDLDHWAMNDSISFEANGGILFVAGAGHIAAGAWTTYLATGSWTIYIEKTGQRSAFVKITKGKLESLSLSAGNIFAGVSTTAFNNADTSWGYNLNLNTQSGLTAYENILAGNLKYSQRLAQAFDGQKIDLPVAPDTTVKSTMIGRVNHAWFGIPLLANVSVSSGKIYEFTDSGTGGDNPGTQVEYGLYVHEKSSQVWFSEKSHKLQAFYNTLSGGTNAGHFVFEYATQNASAKTLRNWFADLTKRTGLGSQLAINVPNVKDLGFTHVLLTLNVSRPSNTSSSALNPKAAGQAVETYFRNGMVDDYCGSVRPEDYSRCRDDVKSDTVSAVKKMNKALRAMGEAANNKDYVKAYAEVGKLALTNQFTLGSLLSLTSVNGSLKIEGEKIFQMNKKF